MLVRGEDVPLRRTRRCRVSGDDADAGLDQVVPAGDVLRVAVPDADDDDRIGDRCPWWSWCPSSSRRTSGRAGHVRPDRERDVVGLLSSRDRLALRTARAVRRREVHALAGRRLVERGRERVVGGLGQSRSRSELTVLLSLPPPLPDELQPLTAITAAVVTASAALTRRGRKRSSSCRGLLSWRPDVI